MRIPILAILLLWAFVGRAADLTFTNLAQMQAFPSATIQPRTTISLLGRLTPSDGGGGEFFLNRSLAAGTQFLTSGTGGIYFAADVAGVYYERVKKTPVDPRWFGGFPYVPGQDTDSPYGGQISTGTPIGTGDFSVWFRAVFPADTDSPFGAFFIGDETNQASTAATFELRGATTQFGFVFRNINGSSATGTLLNEGSVLDSTFSTWSALAGTTADWVVTRSLTTAKVYLNGADVTASFTLGNPAGWAKSLALGSNILAQIGNNINGWYWPEPIERFVLFNSALSLAQSADPDAVGGKLIDYTGLNVVEPVDAAPGFNAAGRYARDSGGKTIIFPDGHYRTDSEILLYPGVTYGGLVPPPFYQGLLGSKNIAPVTFTGWFRSEHDIFVGSKANATREIFLTEREVSPAGWVSSRYLGSTLKNVAIFGGMRKSGRGIFLDRVGSVVIEDVLVRNNVGEALYMVVGNGNPVKRISGSSYGGIKIIGTSDGTVQDCFLDGVYGAGLFANMRQTKIINNTFDVAFNPFDGNALNRAGAFTVATGTDIFTKVNHRLSLGDMVWFYATNTLPAPLTNSRPYFVTPLTDDTFSVHTDYVRENTGGGAINGEKLDITTAGSGTVHLLLAEKAAGIALDGDHNTISGNRLHRNWQTGLHLRNSADNMVMANNITDTSYDDTGQTNTAGIDLYNSTENIIIGNTSEIRAAPGNVEYGVRGDSLSVDNAVWANSINNPVPVSMPENNDIRKPLWGTRMFWNNSANGTLLSTPSTNFTAADSLWFSDTPFANALLNFHVHSDTVGAGARIGFLRNFADYGSYGAVPNNEPIMQLIAGAQYGTNENDKAFSVAEIQLATFGPQGPTNHGGSIVVALAPTNSSTRALAMWGRPDAWDWFLTAPNEGTYSNVFRIVNPTVANQTPIRTRINNLFEDWYWDPTSGVIYKGSLNLAGGIDTNLFVLKAGDIMTGTLSISNTGPILHLNETDAVSTNRVMSIRRAGGGMFFTMYTDAVGGADNFVAMNPMPNSTKMANISLSTATNGLYIDNTTTSTNHSGIWSVKNGVFRQFIYDTTYGVWGMGNVNIPSGGTNATALGVNGSTVNGPNLTNSSAITVSAVSSNITFQITDGGIVTADIGDDQVTSNKIDSINVTHIAGNGNSDQLLSGTGWIDISTLTNISGSGLVTNVLREYASLYLRVTNLATTMDFDTNSLVVRGPIASISYSGSWLSSAYSPDVRVNFTSPRANTNYWVTLNIYAESGETFAIPWFTAHDLSGFNFRFGDKDNVASGTCRLRILVMDYTSAGGGGSGSVTVEGNSVTNFNNGTYITWAVTGGEAEPEIAAGTLPLSLIEDRTAGTLLGRSDAGPGPPEEISLDSPGPDGYITLQITGNALSGGLETNDIPLFSRTYQYWPNLTNEMQHIKAASLEVDDLSINDLTVTGNFIGNNKVGTEDLATTGVTTNLYTNPTLRIGADGRVYAATNGTSGSKTIASFIPEDSFTTTNTTGYATFVAGGRGDGHKLLAFDDTTDECVYFGGVIPEGAVLTSGISVSLWITATATTGTNVFDVAFERLDGLDIDGNSFGTTYSVTNTPSATSGIPVKSTAVAATIDSLAVEEAYRLRVCRDADNGTDGLVGDAQLLRVMLKTAN